MMIPQMIHALRICVDSGFAGGIDLSYNTNITLLPQGVAELWPQFKSVSLSCSIDGYGSLNEYIRRPSRWRDVDRHLHTLDAHFHDWNLLQVSLTHDCAGLQRARPRQALRVSALGVRARPPGSVPESAFLAGLLIRAESSAACKDPGAGKIAEREGREKNTGAATTSPGC